MSVVVRSWFLGRVDYNHVLHLQKSLVNINCRLENKCPAYTILLLEHNPVYTIGIRSGHYSQEQQDELRSCGAQFIKTSRGGLITYHGPGQLMAYPVVNLRGSEMAGKGLKWFVHALEHSGYEVCEGFQSHSFFKGSALFPQLTAATGVWCNTHSKVMSIGVHRSRDVTYHGIGLNCTSEPLEWFDKIVPCGLSGCKMTSLESVTGTKINPLDVAPKISERLFANLFSHRNCLEHTYSDLLGDPKPLPWEKIEQFILQDADFRTKKLAPPEAS